jgi:hypothetical protein
MLIDMTGKFEVLASEYAKTIVREESNPIITGYRWQKIYDIDRLLWYMDVGDKPTEIIWNETEAEEW